MEIGFRSFNLALIDNAAVEYQFLTDFFQLKNGEEATKSFNKIFDRTFQHGQVLFILILTYTDLTLNIRTIPNFYLKTLLMHMEF